MKNSKWMRFLLIALSVAMVLSLFACGDNGSTTEETTVDNTEDTTVEDTTVEDTTVEDTTVEDTTVEDTTVEDTTVEDTTEEDTTVAEPVFENDWHVSVDAFLYDVDGDFAAIEGTITAAATNKTNGTTIANGSGTYPSIVANFVCLSNGWIAVNGADVTSWTAKVYAADGTLLNTVAHQLQDAEEGVVNHVTNNMGYGAGTVAHRIGLETTIIALGDYAGQTVTVVYEAVVGEFTVEMVKIDVEVPALPEEETTAPVEINVELTPDKLAGLDNMTNIAGITLSADGSYVTVKPAADTNDNYFYAYYFNTAVTGRYAVIKYRTSANVNSFNIYASTSRDGATDGDDLVTAYIVADGEWHVMLVDLDAVKTVEADENGDYTVKFLRIDPFRGIGNATGNETVDIAYVGVHESVYNLDLVANSSSILELGNQFTFSIDNADLGGTAFSGGVSGTTVKAEITVSRDNANIAITGGWIAVNGQAFTNMGVYYRIVDANGNATRLTKAGMNIMAAEEGVINHCATANPGATPMRVDFNKGGLVFPDLKAYSGQTVTIYVYAISDSMWEEQGVIAGRIVLALTVTVEKSEKAQIGDVVYEDMEEAFAAAKDGDTIKLLKNVTLPTAVVIDKNITVNLNGKTISIPEDTVGDGVFHVVEGGVLTINGNGTVNGVGNNNWNIAIWVDGGKVIINGGTYTNVGATDANGDTQFDLIYVKGGELVINGGTFKAENPQWTINCNDSKPGTVSIYGGTFNGFDPSNTNTEPAGADDNFLADGYVAVASGANYVVYRALTIPEALEIAGKLSHNTSTSEKYYAKGVITNIYNAQYGNCWIEDEDGNTMIVYGLYSADGSTRYDAMSVKPQVGDTIEIIGVLKKYNSDLEYSNAWVVGHEAHTCDWTDATCSTPKACKICGATQGSAVDHVYVDGECKWCGLAENATTEIIKDDFASVAANASYAKGDTTNGWSYLNCAVQQGGTADSNDNKTFKFLGSSSNRAFCMNGKTGSKGVITSPELSNIVSISFNYGNGFSESNGVDITITITDTNGNVLATKRLDNNSVTQKTAYEFTWTLDEPIDGDCIIKITNNSPSNSSSKNKDRVSIWNIEVSCLVG